MQVTTSDGVQLHVVDLVPKPFPSSAPGEQAADVPVVLWLQGLNAPAAAWNVQLAHFGQTHRSIAPDQRGVGQSGAPAAMRSPSAASQVTRVAGST